MDKTDNKNIIITDIEQLKNSTNYLVTLNNAGQIKLNIDLIYEYNLHKNKSIDLTLLNSIIQEQTFFEAKNVAYRYVSYKPRTTAQVIKKLKEKKFNDKIIEETIEFLKEFNLLNDEKYAKQFAKEYVLRQKCGKKKLFHLLKRRGISDDLANDIVEKIFKDLDVYKLAKASFDKKVKMLAYKSPDKRKQLTIQHLKRQGFEWDLINKILEENKNIFH